MTLEDLAIMVANGFEMMNNRFEAVESRLLHLEQDMDKVLLRLDNVAYRFEFDDLDQRVTRLERNAGLA